MTTDMQAIDLQPSGPAARPAGLRATAWRRLRRDPVSMFALSLLILLVLAAVIGGPLGVVAGRWAWRAFAGSLGVAPVTEVPVLVIVGLLAALVLAGNLLAALPAALAARIQPAVTLRAE